MFRFYCFLLIIFYVCGRSGSSLRQDKAVLKYCNPVYFVNCSTFTKRIKRGQPYRTNVTFTTLYEIQNNVTLNIDIAQKGQPRITILSMKVCDAFKYKWVVDYLKDFADFKPHCKIQTGTYHFWNIELPPKNFPVPVPAGNLDAWLWTSSTSSKEVLSEMYLQLISE